MSDLTITHTPEEGTLIDGTTKGDGTAPVLKAHGWRWGRSIAAWYVPMSRDRTPKRHVIDATATQLRAAGFTVGVEVDQRWRPTAEVEADKIARQDKRAAAMETKAQRAQDRATQAWAKADRDGDRLPPGGEPIKIGHHSEGRHRRDLERAHDSMGRAVQAEREAAESVRRATASSHTTGARYNAQTVANRIERIGADIRKAQRRLDGYTERLSGLVIAPASGDYRERLTADRDRMADELAHWQQVRDEQVEDGTATNYGPETVSKGDAVCIGGTWHRVARANKKTVSVETGYSWTQRAPYTSVTGHRPSKT